MSERKCSEPGECITLPGGAALVEWKRPGVSEWSYWRPAARRFVGAYKTRQEAETALQRVMATQAVAA